MTAHHLEIHGDLNCLFFITFGSSDIVGKTCRGIFPLLIDWLIKMTRSQPLGVKEEANLPRGREDAGGRKGEVEKRECKMETRHCQSQWRPPPSEDFQHRIVDESRMINSAPKKIGQRTENRGEITLPQWSTG